MKIPRLAVLVGALVLSCSPADVGGSAAAQACQDYAYAYCAQLQTCSPTALQQRFVTVKTCESLYQTSCLNGLALASTGTTAAGREACASVLPSWGCADFLHAQNPPPACVVPSGALPNGAACASYSQCQSAYCGYAAGKACGTCAPAPQPGDSCATNQCTTGLACMTIGLTCAAYAGAGAPCATAPCDEGLACVGGTCAIGVTVIGMPCDPNAAGCDIFNGLGCSGATKTCVTETLAQSGQACGMVAEQPTSCLGGNCQHGVCIGNVPAGGACTIGGAPCISNARCIVPAGATSGTCLVSGSIACE